MAKKKKKGAPQKAPERVLTGQEVKRILALLKAREEYPDRKIEIDIPKGFKEKFKSQKEFQGWLNYHVTWDVERENPYQIKRRTESLEAEWHRELVRVVPVIMPDGDIITASEFEKRAAATAENDKE